MPPPASVTWLLLAYIRQFGLPVLSLNDGLPLYMIGGKIAEASNLADWPWALSPEERSGRNWLPTFSGVYIVSLRIRTSSKDQRSGSGNGPA